MASATSASFRTRRRGLVSLAALSALLSFAGLGTAVFLDGCSGDSGSTTGKRVVLHTRLALDANGPSFTTALGWNVTLTQALISGGPLYYFDGAPPLVLRQESRDNWQFAQRLLGLGEAHAHPGHYAAGNALGQMLEPWSADLLAGTTSLADGDGITATYRSGRFSFNAPPVGSVAGALGNHVALLGGHAEMAGAEPRFFLTGLDLSDIAKSAAEGQVEGCEFKEIEVTGDGTVTVTVTPQVWFDLVDFSQVDPGTASAPTTFTSDSQPFIALAQGLAELSAYKFSYDPK